MNRREVGVYREPMRLEGVAQEVMLVAKQREGASLAVPTDISNRESVAALAAAVTDRYERVDVLINNAGVCLSGPFAETTMDDWCALCERSWEPEGVYSGLPGW